MNLSKTVSITGSVVAVLAVVSLIRSQVSLHRDANADTVADLREHDFSTSIPGWASSASTRALSSHELSSHELSTTAPVPARSLAAVDPHEDLALARLNSASTAAWTLRRDDFSPRIRTLVNGQLKMKPGQTPHEAADDFVKTYSRNLFGVDPRYVHFDREDVTDRTRVTYQETVGGIPVYGGSLNLFFENGALTRVQNDLSTVPAPSLPALTAASLNDAFARYKESLGSAYDVSLKPGASSRTVLYPTAANTLVYAYEFSTNESAASHSNGDSNEQANSFRVVYEAEDPHLIKRTPEHVQ